MEELVTSKLPVDLEITEISTNIVATVSFKLKVKINKTLGSLTILDFEKFTRLSTDSDTVKCLMKSSKLHIQFSNVIGKSHLEFIFDIPVDDFSLIV